MSLSSSEFVSPIDVNIADETMALSITRVTLRYLARLSHLSASSLWPSVAPTTPKYQCLALSNAGPNISFLFPSESDDWLVVSVLWQTSGSGKLPTFVGFSGLVSFFKLIRCVTILLWVRTS